MQRPGAAQPRTRVRVCRAFAYDPSSSASLGDSLADPMAAVGAVGGAVSGALGALGHLGGRALTSVTSIVPGRKKSKRSWFSRKKAA